MHAQKQSPAEIQRQYVCRPDIMIDSMDRRWCGQFTEGRTNVHDEDCSGRSSLVTPELMESVRQVVLQNRHFTISELSVQWLHTFAVDSYDTGIQALMQLYNKCVNNVCDYVKKQSLNLCK